MTTLYLGADHAGWKLKERLLPALKKINVTIQDLSPAFRAGDDYPAIAKAVARRVAKDRTSRGVLFCGSGVGMVIAANRVKGVRAAEAMSPRQVYQARQHNDINILAVGGWRTAPDDALRFIKTFLATRASAAKRHKRRVKQLG